MVLETPRPRQAEEDEKGFVPLFDGKSLDGWKRVGGTANYRVEGDAIVGEVDPATKANTFLRPEKTYGDFILKLDAKLDNPSNSGIQFRSHERVEKNGNIRVYGYQFEIDPLRPPPPGPWPDLSNTTRRAEAGSSPSPVIPRHKRRSRRTTGTRS